MNHIKDQFPILQRQINGKPLVYLDNAATTQKPQVVIDELVKFYSEHNANIHRGIHTLAEESTQLYEKSRELTAEFLNAQTEEIIFTRNTTESINLVAQTWGREYIQQGDTILIPIMEHHSNMLPWRARAEECGARVEYIDCTAEGRIDLENWQLTIETLKPRLIAITHQSNVLGTINPIKEIVEIAHAYKARVLVDAAQSAGHIPIDVHYLDVDFLAFSSHKMFGPTGVGVLYAKKDHLHQMRPFLQGGEMVKSVARDKVEYADLPWRFEAGTPNIADVVAFGQAIRFVQSIGFPTIESHLAKLTGYALDALAKISGITIIGPRDIHGRGGVISFTVEGVHAHDAASLLDEEGIAIRSGAHCAQPLLRSLGLDATCRASFSVYTDKHDIDALVRGLENVKRVFKL